MSLFFGDRRVKAFPWTLLSVKRLVFPFCVTGSPGFLRFLRCFRGLDLPTVPVLQLRQSTGYPKTKSFSNETQPPSTGVSVWWFVPKEVICNIEVQTIFQIAQWSPYGLFAQRCCPMLLMFFTLTLPQTYQYYWVYTCWIFRDVSQKASERRRTAKPRTTGQPTKIPWKAMESHCLCPGVQELLGSKNDPAQEEGAFLGLGNLL